VRSRAQFRLVGDGGALSAALVSLKLGIEPARAIEAAHRLGRAESVWILSTGWGAHHAESLTGQLARLLAVVEPHASTLWELADMGYRANWYCQLEPGAGRRHVEIGRQLMSRLLALPGGLQIDVGGFSDDP
jgi:Domain of unknown function (DUF4279)